MTNTTLSGNCHCKNIEILFEISKPPQELWVRKCSCSFCTKQGNLNIADPDGCLKVTINRKADVFWYQMGHKRVNVYFVIFAVYTLVGLWSIQKQMYVYLI